MSRWIDGATVINAKSIERKVIFGTTFLSNLMLLTLGLRTGLPLLFKSVALMVL